MDKTIEQSAQNTEIQKLREQLEYARYEAEAPVD